MSVNGRRCIIPSILLGNRSGGDQIVSGNPWSGRITPTGGVQIRIGTGSGNLSGFAYIGLSGGVTITSGGYFASGLSGMLDGIQLAAGDSYFVPRIGTGVSGNLSIYAACDPLESGLMRLYYEVF